jgi:copper(I)-binding protein
MIIKKILAACFMLSSTLALAHDFQVGSLKVDHPIARATVAGQTNGAAFMEIMNKGKAVDKLLSANSPIAETVEIHSMSMEGDVMKMRAVESLELPAGSNVKLQHGQGYHIMLLGLKKPLTAGDKFPMTLQFEKAGKLKIVVHVEEKSAQHGAEHHH